MKPITDKAINDAIVPLGEVMIAYDSWKHANPPRPRYSRSHKKPVKRGKKWGVVIKKVWWEFSGWESLHEGRLEIFWIKF